MHESCGTPAQMGLLVDTASSTLTLKHLLDKNDSINLMRCMGG